ncbi:MAG: hypothetical protein GXP56_10230 [Deltaproteobacteria bacterium]|nr:hypothetical protein [Deltaproteobacteria bacterium]
MREKLILVAEKAVKKEIEAMVEQIKTLLANRLESIWDEPEQDWVNKIIKGSKIKDGLQTSEGNEKINKTLSIVANHAKSIMYIELRNLQKKFKELKIQK